MTANYAADDHDEGLTEFFAKAAKLPLLTPSEEKRLGALALAGDKLARNRLVEHNIRLGIKMAKMYRGKGVPFADLVQEACVGLNRAAEKFDPEKGFRFTTYATWWIQHFCQRAVQNKSQNIRIPWQVQLRRAKILRHLDENPNATPEELAELAECTVEQVAEASDVARTALSLDAPTGGDEDDSPHSLIPDPDAEMDHEAVGPNPALHDALAQLSEDEALVLRLRFGFDGPVRGRAEIAERLGVDERAVSRLQREAMRKLRAILSRQQPERQAPVSRIAPGDLTPVCSRSGPP